MDNNTSINAMKTEQICNICDGDNFILRDGFYFCSECGTKLETIQEMEMNSENKDGCDEGGGAAAVHGKHNKIQDTKIEKPEITSWEFYNYILRGLVDELISFGAKEELKLMALQLWTAYLRRTEVAFFNKKKEELPRLGARFLKRDARALYNHVKTKKTKRRMRRSTNITNLKLRTAMRVLDESNYSQNSATASNATTSNGTSMSPSLSGSSSGTTAHAIKINFNTKARKFFKKKFSIAHLAKHAIDVDNELTCHKLTNTRKDRNVIDRYLGIPKLKLLYGILIVALNLIEDDIQLSDVLRFIKEGRISRKRVLRYLPSDITTDCKHLLIELDFSFVNTLNTSNDGLHTQINYFLTFLNIRQLKMPNMLKLIERYITELNLPSNLLVYIERLLNILPPQMQKTAAAIPPYEARAMAYIIYVLKLLFGLDGYKEKLISKTALKMNKNILKYNEGLNCEVKHASLFVWNEWVKYVEMRKIITSQYSNAFSLQFKQTQNIGQFVEELKQEHINEKEESEEMNLNFNKLTSKITNFQHIFNEFLENFTDAPEQATAQIKFEPTLTPVHTNFKRILLQHSNNDKTILSIPEFMHIDHSQRTMQPFIDAKELRTYLNVHKRQLKVVPTAVTKNRHFIGIIKGNPEFDASSRIGIHEADFNITEKEWQDQAPKDTLAGYLRFQTKYEPYEKSYFKIIRCRERRHFESECEIQPNWITMSYNDLVDYTEKYGKNKEQHIHDDELLKPSASTYKDFITTNNCSENEQLELDMNLNSFDIFNEDNMDPLMNVNLKKPRKLITSLNISKMSNDEANCTLNSDNETNRTLNSDNDANSTTDAKEENVLKLNVSNFDYWLLFGSVAAFRDVDRKQLEAEFPSSFLWLLKTCSQILNIKWNLIYEQLLVIEMMFSHGIENLDTITDCVKFVRHNPIKDINFLVRRYRAKW